MTSKQPDPSEIAALLEHNQEVFQFLLAFIQMSRGLKIGFIEVNFPPDIDKVITAIAEHPKCASIQFAVLRFDDRDMRFLLEGIKAELLKISIEPDKKLVLILQGLEKAIAYSGDNPPILTNLNYARDSFPIAVPHPLLFALPDYAVTRFAKFAPDFWAWTSSTFKFQTLPETRERLTAEVSKFFHHPDRYLPKPEQGERIDLLERLLQEYPEDTEANSRTRLELLNQLGQAHQSIREFDKAKFYFQQAINLTEEIGFKRSQAEALFNLGTIYFNTREFDNAKQIFNQSLSIIEELNDKRKEASIYHCLGMIDQELRRYAEAKQNYQQALKLKIQFGDLYSQGITYHQLGWIAQDLKEYAKARANYQQALNIFIEFNDLYAQSSAYHQLGWLSENMKKYAEAKQNYQKSIAIKVALGDLYSQASTYHQLGVVAQGLKEYEEAKQNYEKAITIFSEFDDRYNLAKTYQNLGIIAQELKEYDEARQNYQKSLAIKIELGDRYSQASIYSELGLLAEKLGDLENAKSHYFQDLQISKDFQDTDRLLHATQNLIRIYRLLQDENLLLAMAQILGTTIENIQQILKSN
ncbi:tetratricopeptide repeat protein [Pseudanabaena sp. UWO311]|uniref:tetratricopeptide repeat protein n=1 Tax=Pseudanabaena sp. UWO311 TaxID=2487337 RepID=UPI0016813C61|nr:tetratricopeptide repeat protein [Pseudanabaena sp. UWO311]